MAALPALSVLAVSFATKLAATLAGEEDLQHVVRDGIQ